MKYREITEAPKPRPIPKVLYHGTIKRFLPSIMADGLQPRVGNFVSKWFGGKATPLVFADDRRHLINCLLAVFAQAGWHEEPTREQFLEQAALVIVPGASFTHKSHPGAHPVSVDGPTYYATEPVTPIKVLVDETLGNFVGPLWADAKWGWFHQGKMVTR